MHFMGKLGLEKVSARPWPLNKTFFTLHFKCQQNNRHLLNSFFFRTTTWCYRKLHLKIIIYQFSMFKSWDSIASVVGIFIYMTISKFKQVLRSRKGLDYNTDHSRPWPKYDLPWQKYDLIIQVWSKVNKILPDMTKIWPDVTKII